MVTRNLRKALAGLVFGLLLWTPSWAGLFNSNVNYTGYVSVVQTNFFFVVTQDSQFIRVMLPAGVTQPNIFAGNKVQVTVSPGSDGQWYLVQYQQLDATNNPITTTPDSPTGPSAPTMPTSPSSPTGP